MAAPQGHQQENQQMMPTLTQDEVRVLQECNRESFYYRCVPFAAVFSSATYVAMARGILSTSPRFGVAPKIIAATLFGYITGKISYQRSCEEKIMQLPDSVIGEALRKKRGRAGLHDSMGSEPGFSIPQQRLGDSKPSTTTDLSLYEDHRIDQRDYNEGLVDYERGVTDSLSPYTENDEGSSGTPKDYTSYRELRRENRHEYINKMADRYRRDKPGDHPSDSNGPPLGSDDGPTPLRPSLPSAPTQKNKYGDDIQL